MLFTLCIFTLFFTQISLTKVPDEITSEVPAISESSSYETDITTVKPQASSRKSNSDTKNDTNSNSTDVTLVSATNSTSKRSKNNRTQKSLTTVPDESTSEVPEISASSSYETNITSVKPQASSRKSNSDTKNATNLNSTDVTLVPATNSTKKRPKNKTKATTERSTDAFSTPEQNSSDEQRNKSETKTTKFTTSTESSTFNSADSSFETESVTTDVNNDENYGSTSDGAANSPESDTNFSNETLEDDESMSENSSIEFSTVITSSLDDFTEDSVGVTNQTVSYSTPTTPKPPPVTKSTDHTTEPTDTGLIGKNPPDMISSSSPSLTATKATESKSNSASGTALTATFGVLVFIVATFVVVLKSKRRCMTYFSKRMGTRASRSLSLNNLTTASSPKLPVHNQPVGISDFEKHFNKMSADSKLLFSVEFDNLNSSSPVYPCSAALMSENQGKNRWTNILPFDHSRVKLLPIADDLSSDYINANYIPGVNSQREYIATQGPLPHTVDDFWRMVWEQSSSMIVMLTQCIERGKVKCEQYWPNDTETQYYGDLAISLKSESILPEYTIRIFDLQLGSRVMEVKQTHFTMWPDFGCPESTQLLIDFVSNVRGYIPRNSTGPIIVHCSAGVGRTGTYIAVERLLYDAVKQEAIDVYRVVREMRRYRNFMVQTEDQYVYIHECLRDFLRKLRDSCTELSTTESQMFLNKMESSL